MKKIILQSSVLSTFILLAVLSAPAQPQNIPTIVEAEDGVLGPDFTVEQEGGVTYITTTTDGAGGYVSRSTANSSSAACRCSCTTSPTPCRSSAPIR